MKGKYLIVDKAILPDYFEKVIEARTLLRDGKFQNVSEAVKEVGISRSTYYKYKDLRLGVGAFNPFTDNYKVENENWNQFASYKTKSYIKESSRMFLVSLSYNFSFGRKFKATQRKVNNSDNESGVMSTGK